MNDLPASPGLIWLVVSTMSGGGLWFVIRLVHRYQKDFTDRYAARIVDLELENEQLHDENYALKQESINYRVELGAARAALRANGIRWDERVWDERRQSDA